jgi:methylated-DNA-[protein]-cysteine S-methyltransferase
MNNAVPASGANGVFGSVPEIDADTSRRLHARLVAAADQAGLLDVAYRTIDSPVGALLLAATNDGLMRVAFDCEGHDQVLATLADRVSPRILNAPGRLDNVAHQLDEYFAGRRSAFDVRLDFRLAAGFRRNVLHQLQHIGYGKTASYAQVAAKAGNPKAVRAVGTACALNPLPLVVPCHRVVRSDGVAGNYRGGPQAKLTLLALEAQQR